MWKNHTHPHPQQHHNLAPPHAGRQLGRMLLWDCIPFSTALKWRVVGGGPPTPIVSPLLLYENVAVTNLMCECARLVLCIKSKGNKWRLFCSAGDQGGNSRANGPPPPNSHNIPERVRGHGCPWGFIWPSAERTSFYSSILMMAKMRWLKLLVCILIHQIRQSENFIRNNLSKTSSNKNVCVTNTK